MKVINGLEAVKGRRKVILAAGFFDGLHLGHRKVLDQAVASASDCGAEAWALTFDQHPLKVIRSNVAPPLLASSRHRLRLLEWSGLDACLVMHFTRRLAAKAPDEFVGMLHEALPGLQGLVVGQNWRFGRNGEGDRLRLAGLGRELGFDVTAVRAALRQKRPISSTRIRQAVSRGRLREAGAMLGRAFSVLGMVMRGRTIGRRLGYPTANIKYENEVLPPQGVYAVRAALAGRSGAVIHDGVLNLGVRPTYRERTLVPLLELHLLDVEKELYGRDVEVFFVKRLRPERRFDSEEDLKRQIAKDVKNARECLRKKHKDYLYSRCCPVL